jgi:lipoprotein-anchoring transpeptidase ErfK/SrfK
VRGAIALLAGLALADFKGGFAIHGYPSVPAYRASHGCVRIPMWIAPSLFSAHGLGTTVVVHV